MARRQMQRPRVEKIRRLLDYRPGMVSFNSARVRGETSSIYNSEKVFIKAYIKDSQPIVEISLMKRNRRRSIEIRIERCMSPDLICTSDFCHDLDGNLATDLEYWTKKIEGVKIPNWWPTIDLKGKYIGRSGWRYLSLLLDGVPGSVTWVGDDRRRFTAGQKYTMDQYDSCGGTLDILVFLDGTVGADVTPDFIAACDAITARNIRLEKESLLPSLAKDEPNAVEESQKTVWDRNREWEELEPDKRPAVSEIFVSGKDRNLRWKRVVELARTGEQLDWTDERAVEKRFSTGRQLHTQV